MKRVIMIFLGGLVASTATDAMAQADTATIHDPASSSEPEDASSATSQGLEDIVVTAQRREENLQRVPVTVTALTSNTLERSGIINIRNLQAAVPGLVSLQVSNNFVPFIRGVGTNQTSAGSESSVAVYIDGVYQSAKTANLMDLNNIERIEVLKGPQGTLFGRNATGGAISITTRDPGQILTASAEMSYGRFDEKRFRGYLAGPISDGVSASVAVAARRSDGFIKDILNGGDSAPVKNWVAMGKLKAELGDRFAVSFSASHDRQNDPTFASGHVKNGTLSLGESRGFLVSHDPREAAQNGPVSTADVTRLTARADYEFDSVKLVSITGGIRGKAYTFFDADHSSGPLLHTALDSSSRQFSQEIQLQSVGGGPLTWIVGAYYLSSRDSYDTLASEIGVPNPVRPADLNFPGAAINAISSSVFAKSGSVFAQGTYEISAGTRITGGIRYTREKKRIDGDSFRFLPIVGTDRTVRPPNAEFGADGLVFTTVPTNAIDAEKTWSKPTWRIAIDHEFNPGIMGYVSYTRGFKSGAYNAGDIRPSQTPVNPENIDAYEAGLKTELFQRRLRLNASVFHYKFTDVQVAYIVGSTSVVQNAAAGRYFGVDVDLTAAPIDGLLVNAGLNLLDSKFTSFAAAPLTLPNVAASCPVGAPAVTAAQAQQIAAMTPTGGNCSYQLDARGQDAIIAPKLTANIGFDYSVPVGRHRLSFASSLYYNDGYFFNPGSPISKVRPFETLTAAVTLTAPDDAYFLRVWGENLTNDVHSGVILPNGQVFSEVSVAPVRYGFTVGFKFGS